MDEGSRQSDDENLDNSSEEINGGDQYYDEPYMYIPGMVTDNNTIGISDTYNP